MTLSTEPISLFVDQINQTIPAGFFELNQSDWLDKVTKMTSHVLGDDYQLAINIINSQAMHDLNQTWRKKDESTDILSFPYSENEGELFLCPSVILEKYSLYQRDLANFVYFLIIHGLYHLKGYDHGDEMETAEAETRTLFNI